MRGKTIISDNCDVANCADTSATMAEKGEIMKRRRTHCVAEALMMLATRIIHIDRVFLYTSF